MKDRKNYIGGKFLPAVNGGLLDVVAPATEKVYARIPDSDDQDIALAVKAAEEAFPSWSGLSAEQRADHLRKVADSIESCLDELAELESIDTGKPVSLAKRVDIPRASANFRFFASAAEQFSSEAHIGSAMLNYTHRHPLGVVGCISPWNLPLYLLTWKIAPALAAGNTVVAKPSEVTPLTAARLGEICRDAGLPDGVLNIVHGRGTKAGQALVTNATVKAISFTGGTATGRAIATLAAPMFKKLSLELGGKNPSLVFADANFDEAVETSVRAAFTNQGEICLCGSRIFVQGDIYDEFKKAFVNKVKVLKVGNPSEKDTDIGALVSEEHRQKVMNYVDLAINEGGRILTGGKVPDQLARGYFYEPTVIEGLDAFCRTNTEEIFGPVVTIQPFFDEDEAVRYANTTEYGLSATVWTRDLDRAHRVSSRIKSGIVWINCWMMRDLRTPFGGVKNSGVGREGGWEAMRFFTEPQNVCIKRN
ncbi:aldehyde dehydrogenase [Roseivirga sp. BDSF3-8]|uniref:aldehyde dehydrogenase n=1 Tax=Roseivirga sp. BDSF3-8 TaxID=3241598 RepID=UPI0035326BAA